jgi:membrane-associated phospholipid phosphatase
MNMNDASRRTALVGLIACLILVASAILFVDRPVSTWSHATLHGRVVFVDLTYIAEDIATACGIVLLVAALAWLFGRDLRRHERVAVAAALAVLVASSIKEQLKLAFGRTWPETWTNHNPSWIDNGVFGFFPFHGGSGWGSFPSGHTTVTTAAMAVLWCAYPRLRPICWIPVALVVIGLMGADYHFISDMIAGGFLGAACGWWIVTAMVLEPQKTMNLAPPGETISLHGAAAPVPVPRQSAR